MTATEVSGERSRDEQGPEVAAARIVFTDDDRADVNDRVSAMLTSGALTLGANTRELEADFAAKHDMPFAVAVSSGTAALEIILRALDVAGRDVIVPADTFAATAFAVQAAGARPVFADIDARTLALSVQTVTSALTADTAAVVLVHIGGLVTPQLNEIAEFCRERDIRLVEDAAHAHGCTNGTTIAGSAGVAGAFSFYPTKVITSGEGGVIVTADERLRDEALSYRDQGKAGFSSNLHVRQGYAWRMSELHAAVGAVHLRHLDQFVVHRERIAARYTAGLASIDGLEPVLPAPGSRCNYYKYIVRLDPSWQRAELKAQLRTLGVHLAGEVYETPLHRQPIFEHVKTGALPVAEAFCAGHVCLPLHSDMTDAEADQVLAALRTVVVGSIA